MLVTIIFGLLISYLLPSDDPPVHRDLLSPVIYFLLPTQKSNEKDIGYYNVEKALHLVTVNSSEKNDNKIR